MPEENQQKSTNFQANIPMSESTTEEKPLRAKKLLRPGGKNIREA